MDFLYQLAARALHLLPPEAAHHTAIALLRHLPVRSVVPELDSALLSQQVMGLSFPHPIGLAAGFDKDAEVFDQLGLLGFSFVETGSITPRPQHGNPKPRLFRLADQKAIINRYGFNSKGAAYVAQQYQQQVRTCVTGVNLGKNKETPNGVDDFVQGAERLADYADYFTVNVSSPNTPGLRELQKKMSLEPIIDGIQAVIKKKTRRIPLLVKISPDMEAASEAMLVEWLAKKAVDGLVVSNTTLERNSVKENRYAKEAGGLSGAPLKKLSTQVLRRIYAITQGKLLLMGCGGVSSGEDAYEKLCAGASLVQLYTAFIYEGPLVIRRILLELQDILKRKGVKHISEVVGSVETVK